MGDAESGPLRLSFNPQLHEEFRDATVTSDASRERREISVALASTLPWFETEVLAEERNDQGSPASIRTWYSTRPRGRSVGA